MVEPNLKRPGNELGAKTTYQIFLEKEGVPAVCGFHIEDINATELHPWARMGGRGVYLNLEGSEGINDCYICEIAPGKSLDLQKHMFEELIYVVGEAARRRCGRRTARSKPSSGAKARCSPRRSTPGISTSTGKATSRCGCWR